MADKDFLELLIKSQDKIEDRLGKIEQTQSAHMQILTDHTRRSLANEEAILLQKEAMRTSNSEIIAAIQPLQKHVTQVETILKIAGLVGSGVVVISGLVLTILEIIKHV
jgi:hypothetical protein